MAVDPELGETYQEELYELRREIDELDASIAKDLQIEKAAEHKAVRAQALRWVLELIEREKYDGYYCNGLPVSVVHADSLRTKIEAEINEQKRDK